jgi:hypothetical protein
MGYSIYNIYISKPVAHTTPCTGSAVGHTAQLFKTTLNAAYGREINIELSGIQLCWAFLLSAYQLHAPSKLETSVTLCCVTKRHILEWP